MTKTAETLAAIYCAWLARKGLTAKDAAALVGLSPSTSYEYATGFSVPTNSRVRDFAKKIGEKPDELMAVVVRDRPHCRRRRAMREAAALVGSEGGRE